MLLFFFLCHFILWLGAGGSYFLSEMDDFSLFARKENEAITMENSVTLLVFINKVLWWGQMVHYLSYINLLVVTKECKSSRNRK